MSLPESHLKTLRDHLKIHDERLAALQVSKDAITREIRRREELPRRGPPDPHEKVGSMSVLAAQRQMVEREIGTHEALLALGRDQRIFDVLGEVASNSELAREAARDPKAFAKERGIEIPANMKLELDVRGDWIGLRVTYYDELAAFVLTWDRDGFSPPQLDPRWRSLPARSERQQRKPKRIIKDKSKPRERKTSQLQTGRKASVSKRPNDSKSSRHISHQRQQRH